MNEEMYHLVCKDRFDKIDESLERLHIAISGNGRDGLSSKTVRLETEVAAIKSRWKYILGVLAALCLPVLGKIVYDVFQHLRG